MRIPPIPLLLVLCWCSPCWGAEFVGKVVSIADGDTITVLCDREQVRVRLDRIDAPESKQPFGTRSKQHLSDLIGDKPVTVTWDKRDRYGRILGVVTVDGKELNAEMVRSGMAWHYRQFSKSPELDRLEADARAAKLGLWADKEPVEPWVWRKKQR